ncbi:MAG: hypothetical protein HXK26_03565 [Lancefieldella rimae]|uniref:Uncharacterized protein n=1 Tax=Lancefieldella rimae TaxID=1383 RepID=A0A930YPQ4_9ACTN|nr:hypothetical protein [Lancefieldella rimae]
MAVQAILGAFPAALAKHDHARKTFSLYFAMIILYINGCLQIPVSRSASRL